MQTIQLDISRKAEIPAIEVKQGDVGRKFQVEITEAGVPYMIPLDAVISAWYSGTSGEGNYTLINGKSPFLVRGSTITVELIAQMLSHSGGGQLCLLITDVDGKQIGLWNIPYYAEKLPGMGSSEAKDYFSAFSEVITKLTPDESLSVAGKPADAKAVGAALAEMAATGSIDDYHQVESTEELNNTLLTIISHLGQLKQKRCVIFITGTTAELPYGIWMFEITRVGTQVQIRGTCGSQTVCRSYTDSMLINPSFESVINFPGWQSNNPAVTFQSSERKKSGVYALKMIDAARTGGGQMLSDPVKIAVGTEYIASVAVCGTAASQLWLRFVNSKGEVIDQSYSSTTPTEGVWETLSVTATAPAGAVQAFIVLATTMASEGTVYFDDASLKPTGTSGNMLKNPSFEDPIIIPGWSSNTPANTLLTSECVRNGNGRCALKILDESSAAGMQMISDPVKVSENKSYAVSADVLGTGTVQLWLRFFDAKGTMLNQSYKSIKATSDKWNKVTTLSMPPAKAVKVSVILATTKAAAATVYIDNVFLAEADEIGSQQTNAQRFTQWIWANGQENFIQDIGAVGTLEQLAEKIYPILEDMTVPSVTHATVLCDFEWGPVNARLTVHKAEGPDSCLDATVEMVTSKGVVLYGTSYDESRIGQWAPIQWFWLNPVMHPDDGEYCTVERYMYDSVYTKILELGTLPNTGKKEIEIGASYDKIVSLHCNGIASFGAMMPFPIIQDGTTAAIAYVSGTKLVIQTFTDMTSYAATAIVKYTK